MESFYSCEGRLSIREWRKRHIKLLCPNALKARGEGNCLVKNMTASSDLLGSDKSLQWRPFVRQGQFVTTNPSHFILAFSVLHNKMTDVSLSLSRVFYFKHDFWYFEILRRIESESVQYIVSLSSCFRITRKSWRNVENIFLNHLNETENSIVDLNNFFSLNLRIQIFGSNFLTRWKDA